MKEIIPDRAPAWMIAVDIGNNGMKLVRLPREHQGIVPDALPQLRIASGRPSFADLGLWLPGEPALWCVASVNRPAEAGLSRWVARSRPRDDYCCLGNPMVPIEVRVDNPAQVGIDRLLAAVAAAALRNAGCSAIVIDAGSAITVDLVSSDGAFEGGAILPGFAMMATALAQQTDQLPLVENGGDALPPVVGRSTVAAIRSGLYWGHVGAVRELVQRMTAQMGSDAEVQIFVAGGDAAKLAGYLGPSVRVVPHLVFHGIVLTYQQLRRQA